MNPQLYDAQLAESPVAISLVEKPANSIDFQIFIGVANEVILKGPVLIPNQQILRQDRKGNNYYIRFRYEEIQNILQAFIATPKLSIEHYEFIDCELINAWLLEAPEVFNGQDLPQGTMVVEIAMKNLSDRVKLINNDLYYLPNGTKAIQLNGFSIEGLFQLKAVTKGTLPRLYQRLLKHLSFSSASMETVQLGGTKSIGLNHPSESCHMNEELKILKQTIDALEQSESELKAQLNLLEQRINLISSSPVPSPSLERMLDYQVEPPSVADQVYFKLKQLEQAKLQF
jgi:hypothetical protein